MSTSEGCHVAPGPERLFGISAQQPNFGCFVLKGDLGVFPYPNADPRLFTAWKEANDVYTQ